MKTVAICNQKGGVGKTTTAINLAACLAKTGRRILLIDADPQGNASSGLGVDKQATSVTLYDLIAQHDDCKHFIVDTTHENLWIIPSSADLSGAEVELVNETDREFRLKHWVDRLKSGFEFVLIDCPPSLGLLTVNALTAADGVLVPIQCEYYALEGISHLVETIKLINSRLNPFLELLGIVMTMADVRTNLTAQVIEEARNFFQDKVFTTIIPRSVRLSEAPSFGQSILQYDATSIGAQRYQALAEEFLHATQRTSQRTEVGTGGI